jgi:hypothetical protein
MRAFAYGFLFLTGCAHVEQRLPDAVQTILPWRDEEDGLVQSIQAARTERAAELAADGYINWVLAADGRQGTSVCANLRSALGTNPNINSAAVEASFIDTAALYPSDCSPESHRQFMTRAVRLQRTATACSNAAAAAAIKARMSSMSVVQGKVVDLQLCPG